ncbi:MAG: N-acetyltransferase [Candidatus Eremiobacteraeota bacterium]|nr:N-acetyltransferase [Candidatus Eremiobacteraeota bacterium]
MTLEVRGAVLEDAAAIAAICQPIVEQTIISLEEVAPDTDEIRRRIETTTASYPWIVACDGDDILGYAYAGRHRERAGYRYSVDVSVYVEEYARRTGVGTTLYSRLFAMLEARNLHRAFAGITLPNPASIALHRRFGFSDVGVYREAGYKFGKWFDVMWLQRAL